MASVRAHPALGVVVLVLAVVSLLATLAWAARGAWVYSRSAAMSLAVVEIDGGWCIYDVEGGPGRFKDGVGGWCADGAEAGDQVEVLVNPDGTAWTDDFSMRDDILAGGVVGLAAVAVLLGVAVWLRRRVQIPLAMLGADAGEASVSPLESSPIGKNHIGTPAPPSRWPRTVVVRPPIHATSLSAWTAACVGGLGTWVALSWLAFHVWSPFSLGGVVAAATAAFWLARLPRVHLVLEPERLIAHTIFRDRRVDRSDVRSVEVTEHPSEEGPEEWVTLALDGGGSFTLPHTLTGDDARRFAALVRSWIAGEPSVAVLAQAASSAPRPSRRDLASGTVIVGSLLVLLAGLGASHAFRLMQAADAYVADITNVDSEGKCTVAVYEPEAWTADLECRSGDVGDSLTIWVDQNNNAFAEQTGILVGQQPGILGGHCLLPVVALWAGAFLVVLGLRLGRRSGT